MRDGEGGAPGMRALGEFGLVVFKGGDRLL